MYTNGLSDDHEMLQFILNVLDGDVGNVCDLVSRLQIELGSADGSNELISPFKDELISDDNRDEVIQRSLVCPS